MNQDLPSSDPDHRLRHRPHGQGIGALAILYGASVFDADL